MKNKLGKIIELFTPCIAGVIIYHGAYIIGIITLLAYCFWFFDKRTQNV